MGRIKSEAGVHGVKRGPKGRGINAVKHGFDGPLIAPWRRSVSSYKQSITLVHSTRHGTTIAPNDRIRKASTHAKDRPLPLFWARALQGLNAITPLHKADKTNPTYLERTDEYVTLKPGLPDGVQSYCATLTDEESALTLVSALLKPSETPFSVVGQAIPNPSKRGYDNPVYNANAEQPLVVGIHNITNEQLQKQEQQVLDMRKRLTELRNSFIFKPSHH
uniref:MBD_C domain-containing protein n=1 Tax=Panagrellus redivivus TaxID=6233 RepID=A0A7E4UPN2_PANRE